MSISRFLSTSEDDLSVKEVTFEKSLRPQSWIDVIGREREKKTLKMMISSAKINSESLDHILFHGPPGLGKTSLAWVTSKEMGVNLHITSGPAIEKQGDLAAILTNLEKGAILFIDEIHRLNKTIEEILYPAMEDNALDIIIGKGAGARTVRLDLEDFTIIGATTRVGLISKPLLDRFGVDFRLDFYSDAEMRELVKQKADRLNIKIDNEAALEIATRSRRTPRIALKILKRVRDNAISQGIPNIDMSVVKDTLELLDIDSKGLDILDKKILKTLIGQFRGGPVGLNSLAASISEEVDTISDVYEPYLIQEGFIERTSRGRVATQKAISHLGYN